MKRLSGLLLLAWAWWPLGAAAQVQQTAALVVALGHTSVIARAGVTAAYSMDSNTVEASAVPGGFQLTGKLPGETTVILVTVNGTHTINVTVPESRRMRAVNGKNFSVEGQTVEYGQYELRYNNSPNQIASVQNMTQIAGSRQVHVEIMNTNLFPAQGQEPIGFPVLSYEISTGGHRLTLVDKMMNNSPLTMSGVLLRGVHLQNGPWEFDAGITSITEFQDFLLPSNRYEVAGISRRFKLNPHMLLEGNFYYFRTNKSVNTDATPGGIGTLSWLYRRNAHMEAYAELGIGHGIALAGKLDRDTGNQQLHFDFHYQSPQIASLSFNQLHGRTANLNWHSKFHRHFQTQAFGSDTDINLATEKQQIDTTTLNELYWLNTHLGFTAGLTGSRFVSIVPAASTIRSYGYLMGPQALWKHFGGSFQFQKLKNSGNTPGSTNYQYSVQGSAGHVSISSFYDTQTETPVFAPVQSATSQLRDLLQRESEAALNPSQMVQFLRDTNVLTTQDYMQPLTVAVAARRVQYGANVDWSNEKAGHLSFNALVNTSVGASIPSLRMITAGVIWTRKFGNGNMLNGGFALYHSATGGQATLQPVEQVSFQHQLNSVPRWLVPGRRGTIAGHVFIDNTFHQNYTQGAAPVGDVLIYLDGRRSTHTDKNGYFVFHGVPWGTHRVEADYHNPQPFFYTSSSPKSVSTGGIADFGISFAKGRMFGTFTNDAGQGLQVALTIQGPGIERDVSTDGDGKIEIDGLPDGSYTIHPQASTLPPGYSVADLDDQTVPVSAQQAGHFHFQIEAQRSVSGTVKIFDPVNGITVPAVDVEVSIASLKRAMHTDKSGRYLFRHLPAGTYEISVQCKDKTYTRSVTLAPTPDLQNNIDITIIQPSTAAARAQRQEAENHAPEAAGSHHRGGPVSGNK